MAMMPARVMTMATTKASRGRSMKIPENIRSGSRHDGRGDDLPGTHLLHPLDDDQLSLLEAIGYHDVAPLLHAGRDAALLHLLRRIDHQHIASGLIEQDGGLRNDQR